ncbi:CRISPR-associated endonuclease Cas3'' [Moraxella haemolytica]|uniref:CRISPR-associated endonuclease Cas3'' n=1 Tax=Moraxella haemolytica TaxID=2904119 RepID=UPI0025434CD3|nr:CRISPR-associated endonuclease Cas3'' [Moraxella sp. ZY171148]WII95303.1 CRISPR-associated endonuclease Cas3'' [Moraxella sp. ZY171148]
MNVIFISECQKKALNRTRKVLDAYANRIGGNAWQTAITEEGLAMVKKLLRQSASKNTAVSCHRIATRNRTELVWMVGNKDKFNEQGFVPVNYTEKAVFMDLPIETKGILANTHGQPLSQHLFAVGYLAYHIIEKLNIDNPNLSKSAFIAGILHDIGKLDPKFQEWVTKKYSPNSDDELDNIILPDDGVHISSNDKGFSKFSFEKYPRHHEISWLLANSLLRDEKSLNKSQLKQIFHAIYWHHTRPYRKKEDEKYFETARGIDKKWQEYVKLAPLKNQISAVFKDIQSYIEHFDYPIALPKFNDDYELSDNDLPDYREYDNLADKIDEFTVNIQDNALHNLVRMAVISADRMVSKMSPDDLAEYLAEKSLIHALDNELNHGNLLSSHIEHCLNQFNKNHPNSERNKAQTICADQLKSVGEYTGFDKNYIAVLQGPAGCGKTKIALEWAFKTDAKQIIWVCPRVQVCLGILQDLTGKDYLPNASIEIFTGEYKKIITNHQTFDDASDTNPNDYFSGDIVITTIDQMVNHIISHQKITGLLKFMQSHIVFDEFHELIVQPALNLLFAELIEMKKHQKQHANTLLVSATPHYYFIQNVLKLDNNDIVKIDSFNTAQYRISLQSYDETCENNPLVHQKQDSQKKTFVISNTAQNAQIGFLVHQNDENAILLHSKYTRQDKADLFYQVFECFKQNGNGDYDILRSGPIVQASLNISCEKMLTEMTTAENWLQRMGRLDRFNLNGQVNDYITIYPNSAISGKQTSKTAKFLANMNGWYSSVAWLNFLQNYLKDKDTDTVYINELYQVYDNFYQNAQCQEKIQNDVLGALKESVKLINDKVTDPISTPANKKSKDGVMKMSKTSLRGDNCFVQMAVCEVDNQLTPTFIDEYAYDEDTDHSEIVVGLTESINRIQGGRFEMRDSNKNLLAFMHKKHHNIMNTKLGDNRIKASKFDWELLKLARSPQYPIYLSYTPSDLEPIGGERERHEFAMYYVRSTKQPVGTMPIQLLRTPQSEDGGVDEAE